MSKTRNAITNLCNGNSEAFNDLCIATYRQVVENAKKMRDTNVQSSFEREIESIIRSAEPLGEFKAKLNAIFTTTGQNDELPPEHKWCISLAKSLLINMIQSIEKNLQFPLFEKEKIKWEKEFLEYITNTLLDEDAIADAVNNRQVIKKNGVVYLDFTPQELNEALAHTDKNNFDTYQLDVNRIRPQLLEIGFSENEINDMQSKALIYEAIIFSAKALFFNNDLTGKIAELPSYYLNLFAMYPDQIVEINSDQTKCKNEITKKSYEIIKKHFYSKDKMQKEQYAILKSQLLSNTKNQIFLELFHQMIAKMDADNTLPDLQKIKILKLTRQCISTFSNENLNDYQIFIDKISSLYAAPYLKELNGILKKMFEVEYEQTQDFLSGASGIIAEKFNDPRLLTILTQSIQLFTSILEKQDIYQLKSIIESLSDMVVGGKINVDSVAGYLAQIKNSGMNLKMLAQNNQQLMEYAIQNQDKIFVKQILDKIKNQYSLISPQKGENEIAKKFVFNIHGLIEKSKPESQDVAGVRDHLGDTGFPQSIQKIGRA